MTDGPAERPVLQVLIVRAEWQHGDNPSMLMRHPHAFALVDLLALPYYETMGWKFVALDPEDELAWNIWRAKHPEAA